MSDLLDLATRCEAATGPDWELDADIAALFGDVTWEQANYTMDMFPAIRWREPHPYAGMGEPVYRYTGSIDDAMKLVPEGWWLSAFYFGHPDFRSTGDREWHAELAGPVTWEAFDGTPEPAYECEGGNADIPALAICAAALRARLKAQMSV